MSNRAKATWKCQSHRSVSGNRYGSCMADILFNETWQEVPDVPCTVFFEEAEWKALVAYKTKSQIPPLNPPSLREAVRNGGKFRWF